MLIGEIQTNRLRKARRTGNSKSRLGLKKFGPCKLQVKKVWTQFFLSIYQVLKRLGNGLCKLEFFMLDCQHSYVYAYFQGKFNLHGSFEVSNFRQYHLLSLFTGGLLVWCHMFVWACMPNGHCPCHPCWAHCSVIRYIPNKILKSRPENVNISEGRTVLQRRIGFTLKSWEDIEEFNAEYVEENPLFWPMSSNCQKYKMSSYLISTSHPDMFYPSPPS